MNKVDIIALRDQKAGRFSHELWELVKNVACKPMTKKHYIEPEERVGLAALAVGEALRLWEPERGDFALACYYNGIKLADDHRKRMMQVVRLPMHYNAEQHGEMSTINPDSCMSTEEGDSVRFWDSLMSTPAPNRSALKRALKRATEKLSPLELKIYQFKFEQELSNVDISELLNINYSTLNNKIREITAKMRRLLSAVG